MSTLTFTESNHTYALDGRPIPSVTQILTDVGIIDSRWHNENAAARGTYIHKLAEALFEDDLDEDLVPAEFRGYLDSLKRGRDLLKLAKIVGVEVRAANATEWYAGTIDIAGFDADGEALVVDWKSGSPSKWHALQTCAYSLCDIPWGGDGSGAVRRASLYLDKSGGTPEFSIHRNTAEDLRYWRAALRMYHFKRER